MSVTFSTFDRLKTKGVAAYKSGDYRAAKAYLVDAAECMLQMAGSAKTAEARRQHEEQAAELIDLAEDRERQTAGGGRKGGGRGARGARGGWRGAHRSSLTSPWRVTSAPAPLPGGRGVRGTVPRSRRG